MVGAPNTATVNITDNDSYTATITATDDTATEAGTTNNGTFTVDLGLVNATGSAIVVNFTRTGTATHVTDYANIGTSVSIANGQQTGTVTIDPVDDALVEGTETVILTLAAGTGYVVGAPNTATVNITDNDSYTATITATDDTATEAGTTNNGTFTVDLGLVNATGSAIVVNFTRSGTATHVTDYANIGTSVSIANGQQTGTVTIDPVDDALVEGTETVILTLAAGTGYVVGAPNTATVNITDNDSYTATITATDDTATEAGTTNNGTFTVDLGLVNATGSAIVVNFTRTGTATHVTDYANIGTSVSIANGQQTGTVTIDPVDDALVEGTETVILTLAAGTGYVVGAPNTATVNITDNDSYTATITATDDTATEAGTTNNGTFTVDLGLVNATGSAIVVNFTRTGTATHVTDYANIGTSVSIANGQQTGTVTIDPVDDALVEGTETVILTLAAGTGYVVGAPNTATVNITDNDSYTATITATDDTATEAGTTNNGTFTVDLGLVNATGSAIVVNFTRTGTATHVTDYANIGTSVSIANGQQTGTVTIDPVDDALVEGTETVILTLAAGTGYVVGAPNTATVNITDNDSYTATITATDDTATEAGTTNNGTFTVDLGLVNATGSAIVVNFTRTGTATHVTDYANIGTSVSIANGQQTGTVTIDPVDDALVEGTETVILTLAAGTGYVVGAPNTATVNITDNDSYTATITATDDTATEAGTTNNGTFTVDLGLVNATGSAIVVNFTRTGTATHVTDYANIGTSVSIANGQQTGTVTINPVDDTEVEGTETVILSLATGTGYTVGSPNSATVNIISDDLSTISINDPTPVNEGNSGTSTLNFTVSIDGSDSGNPVTVNYTISGGNEDGTIDTLTFPTGTAILSQTVAVTTDGDTVVEADELISVTLSNPSTNASISTVDNVGSSSFTDDDSAGVVINDISVNEEDGTATFTITLNGSTLLGTTVSYQTSNGTAVAGEDYTSTSGTVTFGIGTDQTRTIDIPLLDDTSLESTEDFFVDLTNSSSAFITIVDNRGIATITDDDNCAPAPILNSDISTFFCGIIDVSLNDYISSLPPSGMEIRWSLNSTPLDENAHLTDAEVANPPQNNGTYYGFFFDDINKCASSTVSVELTLNPIPVIQGTMGDERCGPGEVVLSASGAPDADQPPTFNWYASATGNTSIGSGQSFSQTISTTTSFWVEASANGCVSERQEVVATIYPLPSAGTPMNASACSIAANGPTIVDLDDLLTGEGSGAWTVTTDPSNTISIGIGNIVSFEGRVAGDYVFTFTTDNATPPFCENVSSEVTISVNDCDTDTDLDGLFDGTEITLGTDPNNADTDGDGIEDGVEVGDDTANPLDEDGDGIIDALDSNILDSDMDGVVDQLDPGNLNPCIPDPNNEFCEATVDLEITKTVNDDYLNVGEQLTFTITVNNISQETASLIQVSEVLDTMGFDYISHFTAPGDGVYDEVVGSWDIPVLDAGESATLVILVEAMAFGIYVNTATIVEVSPFDIDPTNNEASVEVEINERSNNECGFLFNQFSPNGDGTNDFLIINCITNPEYADNSLEIYDRYGNQVFEAKTL